MTPLRLVPLALLALLGVVMWRGIRRDGDYQRYVKARQA
jgi:hypothetical protein